MNRFSLHFAAFLGSASALALVLVAGISFACQSARAAMGGDKGSEMRFTPASRPQDGLSQAVNTPRPTGGKPVDLRRATREVEAGSPDLEDCSPRVENAQAVSRDDQSGLAEVGSLQGEREASDRGQGRKPPLVLPTMKPAKVDACARRGESERLSHPERTFLAHSSSVSMGESGLSLPAHLRSTMVREPGSSEQGVRSVPGRSINQVDGVARAARGNFSQGFRGGAAWKDTLKTCGRPISAKELLNVETDQADPKGLSRRRLTEGRNLTISGSNASLAGIKPGHHLETLATAAAHLCGVPVRLFHSLIARESSWNPRARSTSGALGLGQLMPAAAKEMGVEDRLDPWQNALGAACFLRKQYDRAGSWRKALLSYHAGPNRVRTSQATHDYAQDIIEGSAN